MAAAVDVAAPGGQSASTLAADGGSAKPGSARRVSDFLPRFSEVPSEVPSPGRTLPAMTKRLHPAPRSNPTLPTFIDCNTSADQAARSSVLGAWACHWGTPDELALLASSRGEARNLDVLARSTLRAPAASPVPPSPPATSSGPPATGSSPPGRRELERAADIDAGGGAGLARLLEVGLVDVDAARWGARAGRFTYWNYGIGYSRNLGMRLDMITADPDGGSA